ncbi:hypothetical protein KEJ49_03460 [Candidatus Bathyarchaeota archaeon]|nr:hypothetical protein [Candidatus Bathyarchaeota archaeon]
MKRPLALGLIVLAAVSALVIPTYGYLSSLNRYIIAQEQEKPYLGLRPRGWPPRCLPRLEVSDDFKERALSIAMGDNDVKRLLDEGYNVTIVKPIIRAVVQGNGEVTLRATGALLVLRKNASGLANVEVDIEAGRVARIIILSRTVIQKSS